VGRLHIADTRPEEAEEFFVYQYLIVARPRKEAPNRDFAENGNGFHEKNGNGATNTVPRFGIVSQSDARPSSDGLRIAFLGNFQQSWSTEGYAADALERVGHAVHRIHEYGVANASEVLEQIEQFQADCLLFFKGRIGVDPGEARAVLHPDPSRLLELLRRSPVPAYLWYYDRVHEYDSEPSRLEWMRRVAPHCPRCLCH